MSEKTYQIDGVEIRTRAHDGSVCFMSDWARWPALVDAGYLRAEDGGPATYGHTRLYLTDAGLEAARQAEAESLIQIETPAADGDYGFEPGPDDVVIVNDGVGVDSTAVLVGFERRGLRPDVIIFADTGAEKPETYAYLDEVQRPFLERAGFPDVTVVKRYGDLEDGAQFGTKSKRSKTGAGYQTILENQLQNETLPSLAFGRKSCSLKWKAEPIDKALSESDALALAKARGRKPIKVIGYDAGPGDSRRAKKAPIEDETFRYYYPLRQWRWDRERCAEEIRKAGLPVPIKSACYICPASKPWELRWLAATHPGLFQLAIAMEDRAKPGLKKIEGLWRKALKKSGRPGSWRGWAEKEGILEAGSLEIAQTKAQLLADAYREMPASASPDQLIDGYLATLEVEEAAA